MYFFLLFALFLGLWLMSHPAQAAFEEELVLDNGLKVIMAPQPGNHLFSVRLTVKTGSGGEMERGEFGLAHLMEHMAFKSTAGGRAEGQIAWEVESAGGSIGAYTWLDETVYHLTVPASKAEAAFELLADMVFSPAYEPAEFAREKEVIVEEIKKYSDQPGDLLANSLFEMAFDGHGYCHPIVGYEDTVREAGLEKVRGFMARHYRPENMIMVLTGGFRPDAARIPLAEHFGRFRPERAAGEKSSCPAVDRPSNSGGPRLKGLVSSKTDLALVEIGFRAFPGNSPDSIPAELLSAVLSQTQASRLDEKVKSELGLATDISCNSLAFREGGIFSIYLETEADQAAEAVAAVLAELEQLPGRPPSNDEIERARALSSSYYLSQMESSEGLGGILSNFENFQGDWRLKDARLSQWDRVERADMLRVAGKMFHPDNIFISLIWPEEAADRRQELEKEILGRASLFTLAEEGSDHKTKPRVFKEISSWPGGPRLALSPSKALPLVTIKAGVPGGLLAEGKGQGGLASLTAEVWPLAGGRLPRSEFLRAAERLGASFSALSGRNTLYLVGRFPSKNKDEGLRLMSGLIKAPLFSAEDVEEARQERLADLRQQAEEPSARLSLISRRALFGPDHPYGQNPLGSKESVSSFRPEDLSGFYEKLVRPEKLVIVACGDVDEKWLTDGLKKHLADWRPEGQAAAVPQPAGITPQASTLKVSEKMGRAQTHLRVTFPAAGLGHPDEAALEVLSDYLGGGMGGPMFMELREKRSLAYDVYASYLPALGSGEFVLYIASDPSKSQEALRGLEVIIDQCRAGSLTAEELEGARQLTLGKRKRAEETAAEQATAAMLGLLYDLGLDFETRYQAAIASVSEADLKRAAEKYLNMDRAVVATVGP